MKVTMPTLMLMLIIATAAPAHAGWTVTYLHPAGYTSSRAYDVSEGKQVGCAWTNAGKSHAGLWSGSAGSWLDLNPAGNDSSAAYGVSGNQQVGGVGGHAAIWNGSSADWVDLNTVQDHYTFAYACSATQQVGYATWTQSSTPIHALLWTGTAASCVDLNPPQMTHSVAYAIWGDRQVGYARDIHGGLNYEEHACLWSGTAASWLDLNPAGCDWSGAYGISDGVQVGYAYPGYQHDHSHASLWSGTAASWVDLHPAGRGNSCAYDVSSGWQVGAVDGHASIWQGTSDSWVDLHAALSTSYSSSEARGIEVSGPDIWVAGWAHNSVTNKDEAILWHCESDSSPPAQSTVTDEGIRTGNPSVLQATWSASTDYESGIMEYQYAIGISPTDLLLAFKSAGLALEANETGLNLQPGLTYYWYVRAKNSVGLWSQIGVSDGIVIGLPASLSEAKESLVGSAVLLSSLMVSSSPIQAPGLWADHRRASGIKIPAAWEVTAEDMMDVAGVVTWADGIPTLTRPYLIQKSNGIVTKPFGISCSNLADDRRESLTYAGINPVGLLFRTSGWVTRLDTANHVFYVDDGSNLADGMGPSYDPFIGLRVAYKAGTIPPLPGDYALVTGIRTVEKKTLAYDAVVNGTYRFAGEVLYLPVLAVRDQADIAITE